MVITVSEFKNSLDMGFWDSSACGWNVFCTLEHKLFLAGTKSVLNGHLALSEYENSLDMVFWDSSACGHYVCLAYNKSILQV